MSQQLSTRRAHSTLLGKECETIARSPLFWPCSKSLNRKHNILKRYSALWLQFPFCLFWNGTGLCDVGYEGMAGYSAKEAIPTMGKESKLYKPENNWSNSNLVKQQGGGKKKIPGLKSLEHIFVIYFARTTFILII